MNQNQDKSDSNYPHNDRNLIVLLITSLFMAAMLSNPQVYAWSPFEEDRSREQKSQEEDMMVVANETALALISYCQSQES